MPRSNKIDIVHTIETARHVLKRSIKYCKDVQLFQDLIDTQASVARE